MAITSYASEIAANGSTAALGTLVSYTVPTSKFAILRHYNLVHKTGTTAVVQLQLVRGGSTLVLDAGAAGTARRESTDVVLKAEDVIRLQVTTVGAAGNNADGVLSVEEAS